GPTNACARASAPNPGRGRGRGNGGGRRSSCGLAVRRSPLKDETAIAIAALDEAGVRLDPQIDPRMAERRRHFARAVAGDLDGFHPNDFRRRDLRYHVRQVATAPPPFKSLRFAGGARKMLTSCPDVPAPANCAREAGALATAVTPPLTLGSVPS